MNTDKPPPDFSGKRVWLHFLMGDYTGNVVLNKPFLQEQWGRLFLVGEVDFPRLDFGDARPAGPATGAISWDSVVWYYCQEL